jgi:2-polyprenyl-3-methyl-5-hydroxy-6-metoxy-1,4-benzoquinol methylase
MTSGSEGLHMSMAISNSVFHSRAVRSTRYPIEDDPDPMVHQQLARLLFLPRVMDLKNKRVLEFGCGSGLNCAFLREEMGIRKIVGFDISQESIDLAKRQYCSIEVLCADACDPNLNISPGQWDVIVSFEVLEHVPDMEMFLKNIRRHLAPGGIAFISTPNRNVFSAGHEPSPVNREHIKELSVQELQELLGKYFPENRIWGQRFARPELQTAWDQDVRRKIVNLQEGTRWQEKTSLGERLKTHPVIQTAYRNEQLQSAWKYLRWELWHGVELKRELKKRPYTYLDFEFSPEMDKALWSCARVIA